MTIFQAFEVYRNDVIVLRGQSARTEEGFMNTARVVSSYFNNCEVEDLTPHHIRKLHKNFMSRDLSINTIRNYLFHIKSIIEHCAISGMEVFNPQLITIPKRELTIPEYLRAEEVNEILKKIKIRRGSNQVSVARDKAIISMLYASGLRASELINLKREHWQDRRASVIGKGGKPRLVFWDERTHRYLKKYMSIREDSGDYMFVGVGGNKLKRHSLVAIFIRLKKLTGNNKLHAHTLRHSFATNLMQNGMHIYTISKLLGHSSIQTTQKYLHISDPSLEEEYAKYHTV